MNREIRIYDKKYQRWYKDINLHHCLYYGFFMEDNDNFDGLRHDEFEIMSYTGLLDKEGNKVFEGDIVDLNGMGNNLKVIVWNQERLTYALGNIGKSRFDTKYFNSEIDAYIDGDFDLYIPYNNCKKKFEIIGNIFDNPNLIKEEGQ